jgi:hypothetical protein
MEGAKAHESVPGPLEWDRLHDQADQVRAIQDLLFNVIWYSLRHCVSPEGLG